MTRKVITQILCDPCLTNTEKEVDGTELTISLGTAKPRTIAVCPDHETELIEPIRELIGLAKPSVAATTSAVTPADETCETCGEVFPGERYKRPRQALTIHQKRQHGEADAS